MRLLLVEDNAALAEWLGKVLRASNYVVDIARDGEEADHTLAIASYDLVILDLSLPKLDGIGVLRQLRQRGSRVPVIVLTANASLNGRIAGLDAGADDYLVKPFEVSELEARIRAQLRRSADQTNPRIVVGELTFDTNARRFELANAPLSLTPREHAVLEQLLVNAGRTLSKAKLAESIFGFDDLADPSAIEIYVHRLRKKLEGSKVEIATLRGLGYLLRHEA